MKICGTILFCLYAMFFMVEYEGYTWNPCSGNTCISINCGPTGLCSVAGETRLLATEDQVRKLIEGRGMAHLNGIYQIFWPDNDPTNVTVKKLKLVPSFEIK